MSDSQQDNRNDKRDRWKMIASLLGATVPEEPVPEEPVLEEPVLEEPHQAISLRAESNWPSLPAAVPASTVPESTSPVAPAMEQPRAKRVHPTPAANNWNSLCGELGVEVPQVVECVGCNEVVSPPENTWREPTKLAAHDLAAPDLAAPDWPTPPSDAPSERVPSLSFFDPDAALEVDTVDAEFEAEQDLDATVDTVADRVEETDREVAGDRSSARTGDSPALRRRRRRGRRRGGPAERDESTDAQGMSNVRAEAAEPDGSDAPAAPSSAEDEGTGVGSEDEQVSDRGRRPRRRRRRAPRREEVRADSEEPIDGTDVDVDDVDDQPDDLGDDEAPDDVDMDLDDDDDDDDSSVRHGRGSSRSASGDELRGDSEGAGHGKHKKIPTWEEAMSVIVNANIESRHRDGDRGRPRGPRRRGRGSNDRS